MLSASQKVKVYGCAGAIAGLFLYMNNEIVRASFGKETYTEKAVNVISPHVNEIYNVIRGLV